MSFRWRPWTRGWNARPSVKESRNGTTGRSFLKEIPFQRKPWVLPAEAGLEDGRYWIDAALSGGSGRASVESPAELTVKDGQASVRITWSSSAYDYMAVYGKKYLPVSEEGNSAFQIPVYVFDVPMHVAADTTAMGIPMRSSIP